MPVDMAAAFCDSSPRISRILAPIVSIFTPYIKRLNYPLVPQHKKVYTTLVCCGVDKHYNKTQPAGQPAEREGETR